MKRIKNMRRFLICLLSFLFIGCSIAGGAVLLSNISVSDKTGGGESSPDKKDNVSQNAPTNDDLWTDSGNYATSFAGGSGQEDDPYQIATAEELAYLAYLINGSSSSSWRSLYYEQTANIDLSAHYWDAIGYSSSRYFAGHYDGGGYTINGLFTQAGSSSTYSYQGLFGYVMGTSSASVTIENVSIGEDSLIQGYQYVGGIVGYCNGSYVNIIKCINRGDIVGDHNTNYADVVVGGICGSGGIITDCYNYGEVNGIGRVVGGISNYATITSCYNYGNVTASDSTVGGISAEGNNETTITGCYNYGQISGIFILGGILGEGSSNSSTGYDVSNCYNYGAIIDTGTGYGGGVGGIIGTYSRYGNIMDCINNGIVTGKNGNVGGIIGSITPYWSSITDCINNGSVSGISENVGGIVGDYSVDSDSYATIYFTVRNCVNNGNIKGNDQNVGGIIGGRGLGVNTLRLFEITNCINNGNVDGVSYVGGILGRSDVRVDLMS